MVKLFVWLFLNSPKSEERNSKRLLRKWPRNLEYLFEQFVVIRYDLPATIVAVMPEGFGFPYKQDAWTILDAAGPAGDPVELVARLTDGLSFAATTAELAVRWSQADAVREFDRAGGVLEVAPFTGGRGESGEGVAFLGLVLVALCLLLIACANVANLLLVRATERIRALGIQAALGASRAQIGGQLWLEAFRMAASWWPDCAPSSSS